MSSPLPYNALPVTIGCDLIADLAAMLGGIIAGFTTARRLEVIGSTLMAGRDYDRHAQVCAAVRSFPRGSWQRRCLIMHLRAAVRRDRVTHGFQSWLSCVRQADRNLGQETTYTPHTPGLIKR